jgi:phospholipid-binding lipoprotein MlaA
MTLRQLLAFVSIAALLSGCAGTGGSQAHDPWEKFNRGTSEFNETVDKAVLKPVAQGYVKVVPGFAREGVANFFGNLEDIGTSLNNLLQGKAAEGASDAGRFLVNTTLGIFGLWDVATPMGLEKHNEDFGQTLGWWGVQPGPYLVLPLLGPSTVRDLGGRVVDPSYYYGDWMFQGESTAWWLTGLNIVRTRADLLKAESIMQEAALDRYTFIRDAWWQRRRNQVYDGKPPREKDE